MFKFFSSKKTDPKESLKQVFGQYQLPSFPGVVMEVLQKVRDPNATAGAIAETLALDPGMTVSVLKLANSPLFCPSKKIESVSQAISYVGLSQVESIVLSAAVGETIPKTSIDGFDVKIFWLTAARRGMVAKALARQIAPSHVSESFTAGFLQDMALPFLANQRPEEYGPLFQQAKEPGVRLIDLEKEAFGWDHAEVATWICSEWELPENLASAIGGHHSPDDPAYDCPSPVHIVSFLPETEGQEGLEEFQQVATETYKVPADRLESIVEESFQQAEDFASLIAG